VFVKICGITNEDDALLAVALGADAVGFVFAPSPRQMHPERAREIVNRLPADVLSVGVFRNEMPQRVVEIISKSRLGAAQLHGHEKPEDTAWVAARVPVTIKAFPPGHDGLERLSDYGADIVLLDSEQPGSGKVFDWSLTEGAPLGGRRLLLAGGLSAENVAAAVRKVRPWGVDVSSGVEHSPGRKDPTLLRAFLEAAKSAGKITALEQEQEAEAVRGPRSGPEPYDWSLE